MAEELTPVPEPEGAPEVPEVVEAAPPEPVEALPERILFINSSPSGLTVWVDGEEIGRTPQKLRIAVGTHRVEVRNPARGKNQVRDVEVRLDGRNLENFIY